MDFIIYRCETLEAGPIWGLASLGPLNMTRALLWLHLEDTLRDSLVKFLDLWSHLERNRLPHPWIWISSGFYIHKGSGNGTSWIIRVVLYYCVGESHVVTGRSGGRTFWRQEGDIFGGEGEMGQMGPGRGQDQQNMPPPYLNLPTPGLPSITLGFLDLHHLSSLAWIREVP